MPAEHERRVEDLLFVFAHWHSLAKLKLHTDDTLLMLDEWIVMLGAESRLFVHQTCSAFETHELKREYQSRKRSEARKKGKATAPKVAAATSFDEAPSAASPPDANANSGPSAPKGKKRRALPRRNPLRRPRQAQNPQLGNRRQNPQYLLKKMTP